MCDEAQELQLSSREAPVSLSFRLGVLTLGFSSMPSGGGIIPYSCRLPKTYNRGVIELRYCIIPPSKHTHLWSNYTRSVHTIVYFVCGMVSFMPARGDRSPCGTWCIFTPAEFPIFGHAGCQMNHPWHGLVCHGNRKVTSSSRYHPCGMCHHKDTSSPYSLGSIWMLHTLRKPVIPHRTTRWYKPPDSYSTASSPQLPRRYNS